MADTVAVSEKLLSDWMAGEIRAEMHRQQISGRALALQMGRSANWVSLKTNGASEIGLNDLERFSEALGVDPVEFMRRAAEQAEGRYPRKASKIIRRYPSRTARVANEYHPPAQRVGARPVPEIADRITTALPGVPPAWTSRQGSTPPPDPTRTALTGR